jgi:hypothetical protein
VGSPPPPDALPLSAQISAGIGVPPPLSGGPSQGTTPGASAGIGISGGLIPPDAPSLPSQISAGAAVGFPPTQLPLPAPFCFGLPGFNFSIDFSLQLPPFPPDFLLLFGISLSCDGISAKIDAEVSYGGGRLSATAAPELDADFAA